MKQHPDDPAIISATVGFQFLADEEREVLGLIEQIKDLSTLYHITYGVVPPATPVVEGGKNA